VSRYLNGRFDPSQEATIGASFSSRVLPPPVSARLEVWDTAGQERYRGLAPIYYRGAAGALVVFDVTCRRSFVRAREWVAELAGALGVERFETGPAGAGTGPVAAGAGAGAGVGPGRATNAPAEGCVVVLLANKTDLRPGWAEEEQVEVGAAVPPGGGDGTSTSGGEASDAPPSVAEARALAAEVGAELRWASAKTGEGVEAAFTWAAGHAADRARGKAGVGGGGVGSGGHGGGRTVGLGSGGGGGLGGLGTAGSACCQ